MQGLDTCKFCNFEYDEMYNPYKSDDWDILKLNDDVEWSHIQILDRLHDKNIECLFADIWSDESVALLVGCKGSADEVAKALNIHKECIYNDYEHGMMILNLFEEKVIRMMENDVSMRIMLADVRK